MSSAGWSWAHWGWALSPEPTDPAGILAIDVTLGDMQAAGGPTGQPHPGRFTHSREPWLEGRDTPLSCLAGLGMGGNSFTFWLWGHIQKWDHS